MFKLMFSSLLKYRLKKRVAFAYERWSFNKGSPVYKSFDWQKLGILEKKKRSPTSNGNNTNVCLLLTYLSRIKGKQSTRRLIVKQNFAGTINVFISQRKSPGNTPAFDSAHVI